MISTSLFKPGSFESRRGGLNLGSQFNFKLLLLSYVRLLIYERKPASKLSTGHPSERAAPFGACCCFRTSFVTPPNGELVHRSFERVEISLVEVYEREGKSVGLFPCVSLKSLKWLRDAFYGCEQDDFARVYSYKKDSAVIKL